MYRNIMYSPQISQCNTFDEHNYCMHQMSFICLSITPIAIKCHSKMSTCAIIMWFLILTLSTFLIFANYKNKHKSSTTNTIGCMAQKVFEFLKCESSVFLLPIGFPFWHGCQTRRRWNKRFNYMLLLCYVIYRLLAIKSGRTSTFRFL